MKYIVIVPDGMADEPLAELKGKTPLEAAKRENMNYLAAHGFVGLVQTIPESLHPGSDVGNLALLGYDPTKNYTGRAPLEAANLNVLMDVDEVVFRCNLVTIKDERMFDYSAGHITSEEAAILINDLEQHIKWPDIRFFPGKSYRHLMVAKTISVERLVKVRTTAPHDIVNQPIAGYMPFGPQCDILLNLMDKSRKFLETHQINTIRKSQGELPANMIWLWGQGCQPELPSFYEQTKLHGGVISAVDLVNGIGRLAGLEIITVPGANGYYDTNYKGKADYAIESLRKNDFVYVHIESPDEAGHNGDWKAKKECIERVDRDVVGTILKYAKASGDVRILVAPDHPTPIAKRTHTRLPVPFVMYGKGIKPNQNTGYSESAAAQVGLTISSGQELMRYFLK